MCEITDMWATSRSASCSSPPLNLGPGGSVSDIPHDKVFCYLLPEIRFQRKLKGIRLKKSNGEGERGSEAKQEKWRSDS